MMIELMSTLFRYSLEDVMLRMTFSQALTLVEVRNDREERAQKEAERRSKSRTDRDKGLVDYSDEVLDEADVMSLPTVDEIVGVFQGLYNG
jgi:hypothetical protein